MDGNDACLLVYGKVKCKYKPLLTNLQFFYFVYGIIKNTSVVLASRSVVSDSVVSIEVLRIDKSIIRGIARLEARGLAGGGGSEKRYYMRMAIPP